MQNRPFSSIHCPAAATTPRKAKCEVWGTLSSRMIFGMEESQKSWGRNQWKPFPPPCMTKHTILLARTHHGIQPNISNIGSLINSKPLRTHILKWQSRDHLTKEPHAHVTTRVPHWRREMIGFHPFGVQLQELYWKLKELYSGEGDSRPIQGTSLLFQWIATGRVLCALSVKEGFLFLKKC